MPDTLRNDVEKYDYDQCRLEQIEERIEIIRKLKYKYGDSIENIISYCENIKAKLGKLLKEDEDIEIIEKELKPVRKDSF